MPELGRTILKSALARVTNASPGAAFVGMKAVGDIAAGNLAAWLETLKYQIDNTISDTDSRLGDNRAPTDGSVTVAKMATDHSAVIHCTFATRPGTARVGQQIYETDTAWNAKNIGTVNAPVWYYIDRRIPIDATTRNAPWGYTVSLVTGEYLARVNTVGYFRAHRSAGVANSATYSHLLAPLNTETADHNGWYDPTTYRYTPQRSGLYLFNHNWYLTPTTWGYYEFSVRITTAGGVATRHLMFSASAMGAAPGKTGSYGTDTFNGTIVLPMEVGDYADFTWYVGQSTTLEANSFTEGWRIGDKP